MTNQDLMQSVERLEQRLTTANGNERVALQPAFSRLLDRMRFEGVKIPLRIRRLDDALCDEVVEARFDNLPV